MTNATVVGFSGNLARPSKTRGLVGHFVNEIAGRHGLAAATFDRDDVGPTLGAARWTRDLDDTGRKVLDAVVGAEVLVVGSPTYKGSYRPVQALLRPDRSLRDRLYLNTREL
ncbi:NADPH-dependent FMN reductase [Mesorhizobium sp.]|uniref:NADPH-dependent FMN reductase n=1 Tax=Mesorhizobium sp. TaxID=1871066 RepID=UPI00258092BB|nr:NAD(P)H-dependent oxidoreductase [Mesorhizobium sp.]